MSLQGKLIELHLLVHKGNSIHVVLAPIHGFSQEKWNNNERLRKYMIYDLEEKHGIIGKTDKEIVDFYIATAKLVIELHGSQHYEDKGIENDEKRDAFLNGLGIKVLRYSNLDVNQRFESVCEDMLNNLDSSSVAS